MKKITITLTVLLVLILQSTAEVTINQKSRVKNWQPGYCAWCCLETLGRNQGIKALEGLAKNREKDPDYFYFDEKGMKHVFPKNVGHYSAVEEKLKGLNVKYKLTWCDEKHVRESVKKNGCMIYVQYGDCNHAVTVIELTDKTYKWIDPNDCLIHEAGKLWFDITWTGLCLSLESK